MRFSQTFLSVGPKIYSYLIKLKSNRNRMYKDNVEPGFSYTLKLQNLDMEKHFSVSNGKYLVINVAWSTVYDRTTIISSCLTHLYIDHIIILALK